MIHNNKLIEEYRIPEALGGGNRDMGNNGRFIFPTVTGKLKIQASDGEDWDHVSVSVMGEQRCPTWEEMCTVKDLFFSPEETVVQFHPPEKLHVNCHPYCLHLWRHQKTEVVLPPGELIAPVSKPEAFTQMRQRQTKEKDKTLKKLAREVAQNTPLEDLQKVHRNSLLSQAIEAGIESAVRKDVNFET